MWRKCVTLLLAKGVMKLQSISRRTSDKPNSGFIVKTTVLIMAPVCWVFIVCQPPCWALYVVSSFHPHNHPVTILQLEKLRLGGVKSNSYSRVEPSPPIRPPLIPQHGNPPPTCLVIVMARLLETLPLAVKRARKRDALECSFQLVGKRNWKERDPETRG